MPLSLPLAGPPAAAARLVAWGMDEMDISGVSCRLSFRQHAYDLMIQALDLHRGEEFSLTYDMPQTALRTMDSSERDVVYQGIAKRLRLKSVGGKRRLVVDQQQQWRAKGEIIGAEHSMSNRSDEAVSRPLIGADPPMLLALTIAYRVVTVIATDTLSNRIAANDLCFPACALKRLAKLRRKEISKGGVGEASASLSAASTAQELDGSVGKANDARRTRSSQGLSLATQGRSLNPLAASPPIMGVSALRQLDPNRRAASSPQKLAPISGATGGSLPGGLRFDATGGISGSTSVVNTELSLSPNKRQLQPLQGIEDNRLKKQPAALEVAGAALEFISSKLKVNRHPEHKEYIMSAEPELSKAIRYAVHKAGEQLWHACEKRDLRMMAQLLAGGAPIEYRRPIRSTSDADSAAQDEGGGEEVGSQLLYTSLARACARNDVPVVEALLEAGADPSAAEPSTGRTPLMLAAFEGYSDVIWLLLSNGANIGARLKCTLELELTALDMAVKNGHSDVAALLEQFAFADGELPSSNFNDGASSTTASLSSSSSSSSSSVGGGSGLAPLGSGVGGRSGGLQIAAEAPKTDLVLPQLQGGDSLSLSPHRDDLSSDGCGSRNLKVEEPFEGSESFDESASASFRSAEVGSMKAVSQEQYTWAVATAEILQTLDSSERTKAWDAMSAEEQWTYGRVLQGRRLLLAQQLNGMSEAEREAYWSTIPPETRRQYEEENNDDGTRSLPLDSSSALSIESDSILLSEEQQKLEQKRWQHSGLDHQSFPLAVANGPSPYVSDEEDDESAVDDFMMLNNACLDLKDIHIPGEGAIEENRVGSPAGSPRGHEAPSIFASLQAALDLVSTREDMGMNKRDGGENNGDGDIDDIDDDDGKA